MTDFGAFITVTLYLLLFRALDRLFVQQKCERSLPVLFSLFYTFE